MSHRPERHCSCCNAPLSKHYDPARDLCIVCEGITKDTWDDTEDKGLARVILHCTNWIVTMLDYAVDELREEIRRGR